MGRWMKGIIDGGVIIIVAVVVDEGIIFIVLSFCVIVICQPTKRTAEFEVLKLGAVLALS